MKQQETIAVTTDAEQQDGSKLGVERLVMPVCECGCPESQHPNRRACETKGCKCGWFSPPCPMCGVPMHEHLGVVPTCRKYHGTRAALMELIKASEVAIRGLTNEFGYSTVKANFEPLLDAIDVAKRSCVHD